MIGGIPGDVNLLELTEDQIRVLLRTGKLTIAVFGLGSVGLAVAAVWLRAGARVVGVDVDEAKVRRLNSGDVQHPEKLVVSTIKDALKMGVFQAVTNGELAVRGSHIADIVVPVTYSSGKPDFTSLDSAVSTIGRCLRRGYATILETSVPPLTTETRVRYMLERLSGLIADVDFALIYSPERVLVGRAVEDIETNYPKIVSGIGPRSLALADALYKNIAKAGVIRASSTRVAEFAKLAEGVYRDVNIALANELAKLSMVIGVDFTEVAEIANTQPYSHIHKPGAGVGGHCIPTYPKLLSWLGRLYGVSLELVEHARLINDTQPLEVVRILLTELGREFGVGIKVAVLGLAYRGNIGIAINSPSYRIIEELLSMGFDVTVHDPLINEDPRLSSLGVRITDDLAEVLRGSSAVVVVTDHDVYKELGPCDIARLSSNQGIVIVDARDVLRIDKCCDAIYVGIGRGKKCPGMERGR